MRQCNNRFMAGTIICFSNLKHNCFFPISALAFFLLYDDWTMEYRLGVMVAFLIWGVVSALSVSLFSKIKCRNIVRHLLSFMTALGICWRARDVFCAARSDWAPLHALSGLMPSPLGSLWFTSSILALVALYFVFVCISLLEDRVVAIVRQCDLFKDIDRVETIIYAFIFVVSIVFAIFCFWKSEAFYGTDHLYDVVYTSDSPSLVKENAYLTLTHPENDLRQPLFAVFAAPFVGIPYLAGKLFRAPETISAILLNSIQIAMLLLANLMLASTMKLRSSSRACFAILLCSSYTYLLSILMLEQYIVAYFWLVLCLSLLADRRRFPQIALWGAGGSLLPSMILLPFVSKHDPRHSPREWIVDIAKCGVGFVVCILAFCRFDIVCNLMEKIEDLSQFTGKDLSFPERLREYSAFIRNCVIAPEASVNLSTFNYASWQLKPDESMSVIGGVLFGAAVCSAIWNREKRSCRIAAGWVCFSVLILLIWGWGTQENGLILYSLYFGWAYLVLLFQLVEKIGERLKIRLFTPVVSIACTTILALQNLPAIMDLIRFAIAYYPT